MDKLLLLIELILRPFYYISIGFCTTVTFIHTWLCSFMSFILRTIFKSKKIEIDNFFNKLNNHPEYLLIVILYIVTSVSIYNLVMPKKEYKKIAVKINYEDINTTPIVDNNSLINNPIPNKEEKTRNLESNTINLDDYKKENNDTVAYLIVDDTNISYPVVQTSNNKYYLEHDFYHKYSLKGAIFADYRNNFDSLLNNTIIYGHHRLDNIMFGQLDKLFTNNYFSQSSHTIKLITFNKTYIFEVFSVYEIESELYYLTTSFESIGEYLQFLDTIKNRSQHDFNQDYDSSSKILTLSTCNTTNTGRLVVHAVLRSVE